MSVNREDMYPHVRNELLRWYPENRGWKIYARDEVPGIQPDFLIEKTSGGRIERSICAVEAAREIHPDHLTRIDHYRSVLSGPNVTILETILAVPGGTDTSVVPKGISVLHLRKFSVE
jgi:hypothetical protein